MLVVISPISQRGNIGREVVRRPIEIPTQAQNRDRIGKVVCVELRGREERERGDERVRLKRPKKEGRQIWREVVYWLVEKVVREFQIRQALREVVYVFVEIFSENYLLKRRRKVVYGEIKFLP